ncbi:MAG: 5-(carboxyamino)imidazole ribonucleotide mutase, partial [Victivallaceae bacterium]|nr:5-(carboxyamino)imidazole ribonucleotide mutase [Victivallaceae bacterium]
KSDIEMVRGAVDTLKTFGIPYVARILSAHRTPAEAAEFASGARESGIDVIICAAGMAAHLAGVMAAHTTLPVIGIPVPSEPFNGFDSLLATVQMPPGVPVATVTSGKAGGKNAALLAIEMLAIHDAGLASKLETFREKQRAGVLASDAELAELLK